MSDWRALSDALVHVIRRALPEAREEVKWKAPSFAVDGRHLVTLMRPKNGGARVVFHRGVDASDTKTGQRLLPDADRLVWATDQRAHVAFGTVAEVEEAAGWLEALCRDWVAALNQRGTDT
ncbi:MAG: DUF1801 domain-containing protein [Myxococcales bacterium]|nr:DUF1801 domain-containing protein [Myxococcales bacterium]MCB9695034.1 DUF1801 domain-containing protein [Alphaproteobacteria bacterium]